MIDFSRISAKVSETLKAKGVPIEFQRVVHGASDEPWDGVESVEKSNVNALVLPLSSGDALGLSSILESLFPRVSLMLLASPKSDIATYHRVFHEGRSHGILRIETLAPTGVPTLHYVFAGQ